MRKQREKEARHPSSFCRAFCFLDNNFKLQRGTICPNGTIFPSFLFSCSPTHFNTKKKVRRKKEGSTTTTRGKKEQILTHIHVTPSLMTELADLFPMALHLLETSTNVNKTICW